MIRIWRAQEPSGFDAQVRRPGRNALLELTGDPTAPHRPGPRRGVLASRIQDLRGKDLPDLWTTALPELRTAYMGICAYLGMRIHPATGAATIDHFLPKSKYQELAYEWSNFRLASARVNSCKGEHEDVLDPFEIRDGWFVLNIGTFEVEPAEGLEGATKEAVKRTIGRLKLNEPTFCEARREYHDRYFGLSTDDEPLPLSWLQRESPFVARELTRRERGRQNQTTPRASETDEPEVAP